MSGAHEILMPAENQEGTQSLIGKWLKKVGDPVKQHEPILELSTDKVSVEIASPAAGVLSEIRKEEGQEVFPGEVLGIVSTQAGAGSVSPNAPEKELTSNRNPCVSTSPTNSPTTSSGTSSQLDLSPAVRKLLNQHNIDPSRIAGTGKGGRITHEDVERYLAGSANAPSSAPSSQAVPSRRLRHSAMRKSVARHMAESLANVPHVTSVFEADLGPMLADRESKKNEFEARGARLTYTSYFVQAAVAALKAVPEANSSWHPDELELFSDINIGIATALEQDGLVVPVIQKAQDLDLFELAKALSDLSQKARAGKLEPRDVQGGTFTISNHGVSGSLLAAPIIINTPQSAILGIGKVEKRYKVIERNGVETPEIRPMCYVTLTIDHRVMDGFSANKFLSVFVEALSAPRA